MESARPHLTKGERTKQRILTEAAELFNTRGYAGTAVTDVSQATGVEKGAVYNYFPSKDALALAAFDYNAAIVTQRVRAAAHVPTHPRDQLLAMLDPYRESARRPIVRGGCPLLNTAIESDDGDPALRDRARNAFTGWLELVAGIVARGVDEHIFRADVDPLATATAIVASIEGGVMLSRLYRSQKRMDAVVAHLEGFIRSLEAR